MDGKLLNHETIRTTNVFMAAYSFIFVGSFLLISLNGFDMVTNFTAVAATMNNIGPGLELVGPMQNFGGFADPAKLVLIFDMLAGRLEIFPCWCCSCPTPAQVLIVQRNLKGPPAAGGLCHACVLQAKGYNITARKPTLLTERTAMEYDFYTLGVLYRSTRLRAG